MDNYNENPEFEKKNSKEKRWIIIVLVMIFLLVVVLLFAIGSLLRKNASQRSQNTESGGTAVTVVPTPTPGTERRKATPLPTATPTAEAKYEGMDPYLAERMADVEEITLLEELLGTPYEGIWPVTPDSMSCIVEKDGKWGMATVTGEVLVQPKYERFSFLDNTGWVEFEQNGHFYVYDEAGTLVRLYADKTAYRLESEEAYLYRTAKSYMSGMEITFTIPEISGDDYYGVEYRNRTTGELLYRAVGGYSEAGVFTYPDETGRAVAIQSNGLNNTLYYITKDGCESRNLELPEGVNARWFDFPGDYTWADISLSQGWIKVYVSDAVPGFLIERYHNYLAFLNVDTLELVPFPEKYQTYFTMYNMGYADAMAIRVSDEENPNEKYAICKGDKVLTEEIYTWAEFHDRYVIAANEEGIDILDYGGELLGSYWDVSGHFINGRMLVLDKPGLYFIDENFEQCSEFLLDGWQVEGCSARGVIVDGKHYFLPEFAMEQLPKKETTEKQPSPVLSPEPTEVPVKLAETGYHIVELEYDVYRYLEDAYIISDGNCYGLADLQGNVLVEPVYEKRLYDDQNWVSFGDSESVTHVFDHSGKELYSYTCNQGMMTTENGQQFYRAVFYRQGMKIEFDYNESEFYYGVHYYNAETGELIFELTDESRKSTEHPMPDFQIASMPDATGTAVVIAGDGFDNTMYKVTKDGYTEETYREYFVERRIFYFSDHEVWDRTNLINGWLVATIREDRGDLLDYSVEWKDVWFNIHTKERIVMSEEYQEWRGKIYRHSAGFYYGISGESLYDYDREETDNVYYAVCRGNQVLTEEIYQWINFDETYIIAGNNSFSHILDYEGNVLAEYRDVAYPFVDGKTLVCDDKGAFYIDENLQRCSEYIMEDVDYCHPNYIRKDDRFYLIQWNKTKE